PNVALEVRRMRHLANSFQDLAFLCPPGLDVDSPPPQLFPVFCNTWRAAERAAKYLQSWLPICLWDKVIWFHVGMSEEFKEEMTERLKNSEIWGICCTDAAGMGLEILRIEIVVQFSVPDSLSMLMQRLGCGGQNPTLKAYGILLAEPKYFNDVKE
ncbi:hypothetical protein K439DRAFT_1276693, partial [Ramaria rubella]